VSVGEAFAKYRHDFPARPPDESRIRSRDELRQITKGEGLAVLSTAPAEGVVTGQPPISDLRRSPEKYLWVVDPGTIPFALEELPGVSLQRGYLSHTNLTGGGDAHSGGEMWFVDTSTIHINGASGRYPARSAKELDMVAQAFKACGYRVASMGWDSGTNSAARYLRGSPVWI
jgi:hypothetical protein